MTQETPTLEQLTGERDSAVKELTKLQRAQQSAMQELAQNAGSVPPERLLELTNAVTKAVAAVSSQESRIKSLTSRVDNYEYIALTGERNDRVQALRDGLQQSIAGQVDELRRCGLTGIVFTASFGEGAGTVSERPSGPGVGRVSTPSAGGNGSRARKTYHHNGRDFTSRELVSEFGPTYLTGKVSTQDVLDNPTKHGLSHKADMIADKLGASVSTAS